MKLRRKNNMKIYSRIVLSSKDVAELNTLGRLMENVLNEVRKDKTCKREEESEICRIANRILDTKHEFEKLCVDTGSDIEVHMNGRSEANE